MRDWLDRQFEISTRGSTLSRELRGGFATYLTMAYILIANPAILKAAGVPVEPAVAGTAIAAGIACLVMGVWANFPVALASGMGLNAIVAFQIAGALGSWQKAMGLVVIDGLLILALVLLGVRERVFAAIPDDLKRAIAAGIGLFIAFIGLVNVRLVVVPPGTLAGLAAEPRAHLPPVGFGVLTEPGPMIAAVGLVLIAVLHVKRVPGALILGVAACSVLGGVFGLTRLPTQLPTVDVGSLFQADILGAAQVRWLPLLLSLVLVDFFDTLGTVSALADQSGLRDESGRPKGLRRILMVDSAAAALGGLFGVSSVTSYIESAAGIAEGARTGLHTVIVGVLFLASAVLAPVAGMVPAAATAPVLIFVGFLMLSQIRDMDLTHVETSLPAFVTLITIPLTYSISHGIGYGFLSYTLIQILVGKGRRVSPLMYGVAGIFAVFFIWGA